LKRTLLLSVVYSISLFAAGELSNRRAPSFSLPDVRGKQHDILDTRGKLLILDFMKTDCPHCAELTPVLEQLKQKYGDRVEVLSIVNFPQDSPQSAAMYVNQHRMKTPILFDCGSVAAAYLNSASFATPHVFVIDSSGRIRNDFDSGTGQALLELGGLSAEVEKWLGGPSPAGAPKKK
jgi:thiol-disulfide isomerase/thioredoxin